MKEQNTATKRKALFVLLHYKKAKIKELIMSSGLLVKVRAIGGSNDEKYGCYEILVPESELDEAHGIIINQGL